MENKSGRMWICSNRVKEFMETLSWSAPERITTTLAQKETPKGNIRITLDGVLLLNDVFSSEKTMILTKKQEEDWFQGKNAKVEPIQLKDLNSNDFMVLENEEGLKIGCSKVRDLRLINYLPKLRQHPKKDEKAEAITQLAEEEFEAENE